MQGGTLDLRTGSATGPVIGTMDIKFGTMGAISTPIAKTNGMTDLYFTFRKDTPEAGKALFALDWIQFNRATM